MTDAFGGAQAPIAPYIPDTRPAPPQRSQLYGLARFSSAYLLIAAGIYIAGLAAIRWLSLPEALFVVNRFALGAVPLQATQFGYPWPGWVALGVHVPLLILGMIFVSKGRVASTRIVYGAQSLAGLYVLGSALWGSDGRNSNIAFFVYNLDYWNDFASVWDYAFLIAEALGFLGAAAAVIAILAGIGQAPRRGARATPAQLAATRDQQDLEWRAAELLRWENAYRLGHNGEAPPAGFVPPISAPPFQQRGTNVLAILALVFGLGGGLLGIIFGHISLRQIKRTGESGSGMAIAGLVLGYIGLAVLVAWVVFVLILANENSY